MAGVEISLFLPRPKVLARMGADAEADGAEVKVEPIEFGSEGPSPVKAERSSPEEAAERSSEASGRRSRSHRHSTKREDRDREERKHKHRRHSKSHERDREHVSGASKRQRHHHHHHHSSGSHHRRRRSHSRSRSRDKDNTKPERPVKRGGPMPLEKERSQQDAQEKIERDTRTVFAYNMTTKADELDLFNFFSSVGTVKDVQMIYDRSSTPKRKGMAYVEMSTRAEAEAALALHGQLVRGFPAMVKHSEAEKNIAWEAQQAQKAAGLTEQSEQAQAFSVLQHGGGPAKLKVHGLHLEISGDDLRSVFEPFGKLLECSIVHGVDNKPSGSGVVTFQDGPAAVAAITQLNGHELAGHTLQVKLHEQQVMQQNGTRSQVPSGVTGVDMDSSQPQHQLLQGDQAQPAVNGAGMIDQHHLQQVVQKQEQSALQNGADKGRELLDDESQGFKLDSSSRVQLMQRYAGGQEVVKQAQQGANATAPPSQQHLQPAQEAKALAPDRLEVGVLGSGSPIPTECVLLKNMFDPSEETEEKWWLDIQEEVQEEASKFGQVEHVWVDKDSNGFVYLKFGSVEGAKNAYDSLSGRYFSGRRIAVEYQFKAVYDDHFGLIKKG